MRTFYIVIYVHYLRERQIDIVRDWQKAEEHRQHFDSGDTVTRSLSAETLYSVAVSDK